jgi:hypothetical protein
MTERLDGITHKDGRLFFTPASVRDYLVEKKTTVTNVPDQLHLTSTDVPFDFNRNGMSWMGLNYCDPETQEIRPGTTEEAIQMARFWDAWDVDWCVPLNP